MKCSHCGSGMVRRNGHRRGKQNYLCKACDRQFVEFYSPRGYSEDAKQICLRMHRLGIGFREIERLTGVSHNTLIQWMKQAEDLAEDAHSDQQISSPQDGSTQPFDRLQPEYCRRYDFPIERSLAPMVQAQ